LETLNPEYPSAFTAAIHTYDVLIYLIAGNRTSNHAGNSTGNATNGPSSNGAYYRHSRTYSGSNSCSRASQNARTYNSSSNRSTRFAVWHKLNIGGCVARKANGSAHIKFLSVVFSWLVPKARKVFLADPPSWL
jgi:hypothetical protein